MSVFHGIRDIEELDGPTFFRLAYRLPAYQGACRVDVEALLEAEWVQEEVGEQDDRTPEEIRADLYPDQVLKLGEEEQVSEPMSRGATLEDLEKAGPPAPILSELAPIFEVMRPAEDS